MTELAARGRAGFARVLRAAGKLRTYRKKAGLGAYDPATGGIADPAVTEIQLQVALISQVQNQTPDGQDRFTRVALLPPTYGDPPEALAPNDGDEILDGGRTYTLGDLAPHEIAGEVVGYRAVVRAGQ